MPWSEDQAYLTATVEPVLRPLLLQAVAEKPADFRNWLHSRSAEDATQAGDHKEDPPSPFSLNIYRMLRLVQTEQQAKLTEKDLKDIDRWLDEDCSTIDSYLPENPDNKDRYTPLGFAARLGEKALVNLLLDRGSKAINKRSTRNKDSPIFGALFAKDVDLVNLLLDRGGAKSIDAPNVDDATPVDAACFFGATDILRTLLDRGSQAINSINMIGNTPLASAMTDSCREAVQILVERGADRKGKTDLWLAAALGDADRGYKYGVRWLLDKDASALNTADNEWGATPLNAACYNGHRAVAELLVERGAERTNMTTVYFAASLGDAVGVAKLLAEGDQTDIDAPATYYIRPTPLHSAAYNCHAEVVRVLLGAGSQAASMRIGARMADSSYATSERDRAGVTPLDFAVIKSIVRSDAAPTVKLLMDSQGNSGAEAAARNDYYADLGSNAVYDNEGKLASQVGQTLRAYESAFGGHIVQQQGIACVASWPGIYARLFDQILAGGKQGSVSAAVVFLPEHHENYGKHGSDKCYCDEIYGRGNVEWGCLWFELWRGHVKTAVALGQRLQVYHFEGRKGRGKVGSWEACRENAIKRNSFWLRRRAFLSLLPEWAKQYLAGLSSERRDDSTGERPGSERGDAEEAMFAASLSEEDRAYLERQKGLGNSQKAEVAWLEQQGFEYEEVDVREYVLA